MGTPITTTFVPTVPTVLTYKGIYIENEGRKGERRRRRDKSVEIV